MLAFTDRAAIYPFTSLMLVLASQCTVLAGLNDSSFAGEAFSAFTTARCRLEFDQCHCNARRSGRVDGNGMDRCIFAKHLAGCLQTQFGGVWLWQIVLALVTLIVALMQPRNMPRLLFMLTTAQFFLLAGVGHATLNEGVTEKIHQTNHAIHLICAAAWFGDYCRCSGVCNSSKAVGDADYSGADAFSGAGILR